MEIKEYKLKTTVREIFNNFLNDESPVLLESQKLDRNLGRYSIIASNPFFKIRSKGKKVEIFKDGKWKDRDVNPLDALVKYMERYKVEEEKEFPFIGGAIGYFAYDFYSEIEKLNINQEDDLNIYDMYFSYYNEIVLIDNKEEKIYLISHKFVENFEERINLVEKKILTPSKIEDIFYDKEVEIENEISRDEYFNAISCVKDNIEKGNVYQINFTQRFNCNLNKSPFTLYNRLFETNKSPFAAYLDYEDYQIVSSSPERFVRVKGRNIDTRPIKGTIARGENIKEDIKNREILENSEKDQAELLMIIDLERNDMGKICESGSIKVEELFHIEEYATVFQQVANVSGKLRENFSIKEIIEGIFPGGSITGAPKISAMELIGRLEKKKRNIYTGNIGYLSFNGSMDFSIAIRSVLCKESKAYYQVGGGIIWDSDTKLEYEESLLKGKALKEALVWR
ncbi:aminodeoxychorismate synthase component I [Fusobacterium sp. MFO224]|uniref:aminodeoxychorismate synthase component I n=1 Tax=Fusobacterium sp. MFO224 TaxID=3378070 RepID=UPI003854AB6A